MSAPEEDTGTSAAHALLIVARGLASGAVSIAMHAGTVHEGSLPDGFARRLHDAADSLRVQAAELDRAAELVEARIRALRALGEEPERP